MFLFFGLFKKSKGAALKLKQSQEVEVELYNEDKGYESHFTRVLDVQSKKVIIKSPGTDRRPIRMIPGQQLHITTVEDNSIHTFDSVVVDAGDREFDIAPPSNVTTEPVPSFDDEHQLEVAIKVEFRAMQSAHNQMANTYSVASNGLMLTTNLRLPSGTQLHLEVDIPNAPDFSIKGRVGRSTEHPTLKNKYICEVEYDSVSEAESEAIIRYAIYAKKRAERIAQREASGL
ncbi:flagellar brake domain-containing protein [bacterium]|nr:flagellar brake domain-containing protein [bacterium]